jgi:DHA2 family methylenomycin A resistance protein-like MFS transporter
MTARSRGLALVTVCIALFLALLDSTAISIALPLMARDLDTGISGLQWTAECYVLLMAGALLSSGTLGDRLGRKQVFLAGVLLFTAGSVVSALAGSLPLLFMGRALQGLGAAGMSPQTLAIIGTIFPERGERARALGIWSGTSGLALVLGPLIGGMLASRWGWQSIFWLNVPLGVAAVVLGARTIPAPATSGSRGVDIPGQLLAVAVLVGLSFAIVDAGGSAWLSAPVLVPLAVAAVAVPALVYTERRSAEPMLPPSLFRSRGYVASIAVLFCVAFGMYASFFLLSLELQQVYGLSAAGAGIRFLPAMGTAVITAPLAGRMAGRLGERNVVMFGTGMAGVSLLLLSVAGLAADYGSWWPLLVTLGLGIGATFAPTNSALLANAPPEWAGIAGAVGQLCQQAGTAIGVGTLGATASLVIRGRLTAGLAALGIHGASPSRLTHDLIGSTARASHDLPAGVPSGLLRSALTSGVQHGLLAGAVAFFCGTAVAVLIGARQQTPVADPARDAMTATARARK